MFPTAGSEIYRNDAGEVLGWSAPADDYPEYCDDCGGSHSADHCPMDDYDDSEED